MASTYSTSLKLELIGNGDQSGTWGTTTNNNLGTLLEQAITGVQAITMANTDYTLTNFNGAADEARNAVLVVGGTNSAIRNIIAPSVEKVYVIKNATVGGYAVTIKTSAGTGVSIANGTTATVYCDSSEFYYVTYGSASTNTANSVVLRDGSGNFAANVITATTFSGQLSGTITSATTATTQSPGDNSTKVATTAFVSNVAGSLGTMSTQNANNVNITGGSITGITDLAVADGGTGSSTLTANAVLLGNGTSAVQTVAPGTSGNVLTSNGTTWQSTAAAGGLGIGQTWQDVTGSRAAGTTYTNSTGKPIQLLITTYKIGSSAATTFYVAGVAIAFTDAVGTNDVGNWTTTSIIVPDSATYSISGDFQQWAELR
jgi:hypothetical protein